MGNWDWVAALAGLAFVLLAIAVAIVGGEPPDLSDDGVEEVVAFYTDNEGSIYAAVLLQALAATALVLFAGYLRRVLREAEGEGRILSAIALAGATILATGIAIDATISFALVDSVDDIDPAAVEALSALWSNDFIPIVVGAQIFILAVGASVVRHGALPKWLGWVAIALAVIALTPIGWIAFLGAMLWIAVISVLLAMRARRDVAAT